MELRSKASGSANQRVDAHAHEAFAEIMRTALEAGLSKREIARVAGVGRSWIGGEIRLASLITAESEAVSGAGFAGSGSSAA